jgi:hypothetical protein
MPRDPSDIADRYARLVDRPELIAHDQQLGGHGPGISKSPRRPPDQHPDVVEADLD